ncbi:MAG: hypothetical protein AAB922_03060 [Patescibacteria group bacterium]
MQKIDELSETIGYIKAQVEKIDGLEIKVDNVQKKVDRMYGYAAGAGAMATFTVYFLKVTWDKFFNTK